MNPSVPLTPPDSPSLPLTLWLPKPPHLCLVSPLYINLPHSFSPSPALLPSVKRFSVLKHIHFALNLYIWLVTWMWAEIHWRNLRKGKVKKQRSLWPNKHLILRAWTVKLSKKVKCQQRLNFRFDWDCFDMVRILEMISSIKLRRYEEIKSVKNSVTGSSLLESVNHKCLNLHRRNSLRISVGNFTTNTLIWNRLPWLVFPEFHTSKYHCFNWKHWKH